MLAEDKACSRMIASNEIRFKKLALPCMTARTPLDMIATDCRNGTIQLTLEQAPQPTALSDLMQAADPTTMLHDEMMITLSKAGA